MSDLYLNDNGIFNNVQGLPDFDKSNLTLSCSEICVSDFTLHDIASAQNAVEKSASLLIPLGVAGFLTFMALGAEGLVWAEKLVPLSLAAVAVGCVMINIMSPLLAKIIINASIPKVEKGMTLYVVDAANVVRPVQFEKFEYTNLLDKVSLVFTVKLNGTTLLVDNSKVFYSFDAAQNYADYQHECMTNAIYSAMTNSDANRVLSDPELCDIFLAYTNSVPNAFCLNPRWKTSALTHAVRYFNNSVKYVSDTYAEFDTEKTSSKIICPVFRRGASFWETPSCKWWTNDTERDVKDFIDYYREFKKIEETLQIREKVTL